MDNLRIDNRRNDELREVSFIPNFTNNKDGSCLVSFGNTKVLCNATFNAGHVPGFLRNSGQGWVTAEYSMLPKATNDRNQREAVKGGQTGRTLEIQRLIGRSLRAVVDMSKLGENGIIIDCDVIQADGGTRTASICGGYIVLYMCIQNALKNGIIKESPIINSVAAVSCGIVNGQILLDLKYEEDSNADVDANFIISGTGELIDIQATSEGNPFKKDELLEMLSLAEKGISEISALQQKTIESLKI